MLTKIRTIERLGVFGNFVADNNLPDFKRYNVIYGENGSGKTTLSRLIGSLQLGEHPEHPELRFSILTQSGPLSQGQKHQRQVRVFNSDYIEASIGQFQTPLQHILIVGEENKALAEEVKTEKSVLSERLQKIDHANRVVERLENDKGKLFSLTAKLIGEATSGSIPRNYRKPQAEAAFAQNPNPKPLAEEQMNLCRSTVRQEPLNPISFNMLPLLEADDAGIQEAAFEYAAKIPLIVKQLLQRSVQSDLLKKLEFEHPRIASWVEQGLTVHQMHGSQHCKFCDQPLPEARLAALMDHFGAEDQRLKQDILDAQQKIRETIESFSSLSPPSKLALYSELREDFEDALNILNKSLHELVNQLKAVHACLDRKLLERSKSYEELITLDAQPLSESLAAISRLINTHNSKTESFNQAKDEAAKALGNPPIFNGA